MTPEMLLEILKKEEAKGYFLHADEEHVMGTIEGLIENHNTHGYLCCPCRMPCEDAVHDEDIICPCAYRDEDMQEFGACFCTLFVTEENKDDPNFFPEVDDRRPIEKVK